ncbi:MAG: response regulator [Nitrospira sp.]|nr:response regulator [Nitrospira sp.]
MKLFVVDEGKPVDWGSSSRRGTETVLVAEDDADVRELIKDALEQYGYSVIEAIDGSDAIEKFNENKDKMDIAIVDLVMPGRNGFEVFHEIKKVSPEARIIFMSGYTADFFETYGFRVKETNIIFKPISPLMLLKKIREVLDKTENMNDNEIDN